MQLLATWELMHRWRERRCCLQSGQSCPTRCICPLAVHQVLTVQERRYCQRKRKGAIYTRLPHWVFDKKELATLQGLLWCHRFSSSRQLFSSRAGLPLPWPLEGRACFPASDLLPKDVLPRVIENVLLSFI